MKRILLLFIIALFVQNSASASENNVLVVEMKDTITRADVELLKEALQRVDENTQGLILILNTPGGNFQQTLEIIELIERSEVPVIGYVYPKGAKAWSAGTFILLSTHVAAMAPYSIIGSCQPAYISPQGIQAINESKTINAIIALLEERARMHGRNVSVVREFVIENLNLNAEQAIEANVIEFISSNIENLLEMTDGLTVNNKTLLTKGARINYFSPSFRVSLLDVIANPLIASLLLIIGLYALVFGLSSPGFGSEIFGAIAICLALIGLGFNLSLAALFLVFFGIGLVLFEITSPGFGAIGIAGIVCLTIGSILLVPLSYPKWFVSPEFQRTFILSLMVPAIIFACFLTFALLKVVQIRHKRPVIGELIGEEAEVIELITPKKAGYVNYRGERWKAKSTKRIKPGEEVIIMNKVGSVLMVKPKKETS